MNWVEGRTITKVSIPLTRVCNRSCPDCGVRRTLTWFDKGITEKEVPLDELMWVGQQLGHLESVEFAGGEPTLHSQFATLAERVGDMFDCHHFMLVTNGLIAKQPERLHLLKKFQSIYVSHYTEAFAANYPGQRPNTTEVNTIREYCEANGIPLWIQGWNKHTPYVDGPFDINRCSQPYSNQLGYYERRLYGCCVAYALEKKGNSIPLTLDWRDHLPELTTPCDTCFGSQGIRLDWLAR